MGGDSAKSSLEMDEVKVSMYSSIVAPKSGSSVGEDSLSVISVVGRV